VRAEVRHQLKQDKFSQATFQAAGKTADWSAAHKATLVVAAGVIVVIAGLGFGGWYYLNQQDQKASIELNQAVRTMDTSLRPAGTPAQPDFPTFVSSQERATAARKQLQAIVDKYPHTHTADVALYFLGLTAADLGDAASAERTLQKVADLHNPELSSLAKFALASVYRNQNRNPQAIDLYNALIAKPTSTVSKAATQLELGATYEAAQRPMDAKRIYEQIKKENPVGSQAAQTASDKLQALK
jgi:tetratricopeptide (TPR) repeat protein